ncbi:MAG: hypothetical protein JXA71_10070 [Chitinispirillaceae bacterium]|nr:hypothetical protein [Chitinispirillaceae bacterium]
MKLKAMILSGILAAVAYGQPTTVVLQQGLNGYEGCEDAELRDPNRGIFGRGPIEAELVVSEY